MPKPLIIGSRGSDLALWQANYVQALLNQANIASEIRIIQTKGDQIQHLSLDKLEGKGFFTKEIEDALLRKEIDIAVHSHKDLETTPPEGLIVAAVSERADARELLLIRPECKDETQPMQLKKEAVVGTSSARRKSQVLSHRSDVHLKDIRGNVPTRVQKLRDGQFDAILLAKAGVDRLNLSLDGLHVVVLDHQEFVPAPAQGALAIQCREDDMETLAMVKHLHHAETAAAIHIERTILNRMKGGCHLPLGVHAEAAAEGWKIEVAFAQSWDAPTHRWTERVSDADQAIEDILTQLMSA